MLIIACCQAAKVLLCRCLYDFLLSRYGSAPSYNIVMFQPAFVVKDSLQIKTFFFSFVNIFISSVVFINLLQKKKKYFKDDAMVLSDCRGVAMQMKNHDKKHNALRIMHGL